MCAAEKPFEMCSISESKLFKLMHLQVERPARAGRSNQKQNQVTGDGQQQQTQLENEEWESALQETGLLVDYTSRFMTKVYPAGKRIFNSTNLPPVPLWFAHLLVRVY